MLFRWRCGYFILIALLEGCVSLIHPPCLKGECTFPQVVVKAQYAGYMIEEVPIVFVDRLLGHSKLGPSEFILFLKGLIRLLFTL